MGEADIINSGFERLCAIDSECALRVRLRSLAEAQWIRFSYTALASCARVFLCPIFGTRSEVL